MNTKSICYVALIFLLGACQFLDKKVPNKEELLQKELQSINWKQVDEYPSFVQCDSLPNAQDNRNCFFSFLTELIEVRLGADTLSLLYPDLDTINLKVTVMPNATFRFEPQISDTLTYNK